MFEGVILYGFAPQTTQDIPARLFLQPVFPILSPQAKNLIEDADNFYKKAKAQTHVWHKVAQSLRIFVKDIILQYQHFCVAQSGPIFENFCQRYPLKGTAFQQKPNDSSTLRKDSFNSPQEKSGLHQGSIPVSEHCI